MATTTIKASLPSVGDIMATVTDQNKWDFVPRVAKRSFEAMFMDAAITPFESSLGHYPSPSSMYASRVIRHLGFLFISAQVILGSDDKQDSSEYFNDDDKHRIAF